MPHPTPQPGERGFALLIVLWSVVLLALVAAAMSASGRAEVQLAGNLRAAAEAEAAADGAVYAAAYHVLDRSAPWPADGRPITVAGPGARVTVCIENKSGKINPNKANSGLLAALFRELGLDGQAASGLGRRFMSGARLAWPLARRPIRRPAWPTAHRGAPFPNLYALTGVIGMTPAIMRRISPFCRYRPMTTPTCVMRTPSWSAPSPTWPGPPPPAADAPSAPRTVSVSAIAETARGGRFGRRAAIRLGGEPLEPLVTVLAWDAADAAALPCRSPL